jgi:hypothetical protein
MGKTLINNLLTTLFYKLKSPASYSGIQALYTEAKKHNPKVTLKDVETFLHNERTWTLYKPARKRYKRLKTIPSGLNTDWQCDLCIFDDLKNQNDQYRYLLVCIDVLSRKIHVAPAKTKRSEDMIDAFNRVFAKSQALPHKLYSDSGVEFQAKKMLEYFQQKQILKRVMFSPHLHAGVVERANKTIKLRLYKYFSQNNTTRWVEAVQKIVDGINNSVNRTIGMTPNQVTYENAQSLWQRLYKQEENGEEKHQLQNKFARGDIVRIAKEKGTFGRSFHPNYTDELFRITKVNPTNPPSYRIEDLEGNKISGIFYAPDLVKTTLDTTHRIAEVLRTRKRKGVVEHFVRWVGYSDKYNSWIKDSDLVTTPIAE